jgi:hypothetical protein
LNVDGLTCSRTNWRQPSHTTRAVGGSASWWVMVRDPGLFTGQGAKKTCGSPHRHLVVMVRKIAHGEKTRKKHRVATLHPIPRKYVRQIRMNEEKRMRKMEGCTHVIHTSSLRSAHWDNRWTRGEIQSEIFFTRS